MSYLPTKKTKERLEDLEDVTDGDGADIAFTSATMKGHIIPSENDVFDIGSAERKVRDFYLGSNSLWIGDNHKVEISGGKMKFRKRRANQHPAGLDRLMDLFIVELSQGIELNPGSDAAVMVQAYIGMTDEAKLEVRRLTRAHAADGAGIDISNLPEVGPGEWFTIAKYLGNVLLNHVVPNRRWNPDIQGVEDDWGNLHFSDMWDTPNDLFYTDDDFDVELGGDTHQTASFTHTITNGTDNEFGGNKEQITVFTYDPNLFVGGTMTVYMRASEAVDGDTLPLVGVAQYLFVNEKEMAGGASMEVTQRRHIGGASRPSAKNTISNTSEAVHQGTSVLLVIKNELIFHNGVVLTGKAVVDLIEAPNLGGT